MVMEYTKCSKTEAIKALRETNDDSVNAIIEIDQMMFIYSISTNINFIKT